MDKPRWFMLLVIGLLLVASVAMVLPFLQFFLLTVLLAYVLQPIQVRLEQRVRPGTAAAIIVLVATTTVILPLVYVVRIAVVEAASLVGAIRSGDVDFARTERFIEESTGVDVDLLAELQSAAGDVEFGSLMGLVDTILHTLVGLGLTVFLLYYFLKDADKFVTWLRISIPLPTEVTERLFTEIDQIMKAVLVGHVLVAVIQGALAGIGLFLTGVPNAILWTVVMVVLSLLPLVGSFLVWGPAALFLLVEGQVASAIFLALWGAVVVGVSDDYLRPVIVDRYAEVNPSVIILGVLGGIYVFGVMGIFFGPLIIGILRSAIDVYREEYRGTVGSGNA